MQIELGIKRRVVSSMALMYGPEVGGSREIVDHVVLEVFSCADFWSGRVRSPYGTGSAGVEHSRCTGLHLYAPILNALPPIMFGMT